MKIINEEPCDSIKPLEECLQLNRQLKLFLDCSANIFVLLDADANFVYGSSNFLQLLGLEDFSSLLGKPIRNVYQYYHDDALARRNHDRFVRLMTGTEEMFVEDEELNWPMMGKRFFRMTFRRIPSHNGKTDRVLVIFTDVTEVRLEEAKRRVNELLHSSQLPTVVWDEEGNIVACNEEIFRIFGIPSNLPPCKYIEILDVIRLEYQTDGRKTEEVWQATLREAVDKGFARVVLEAKKTDGTFISFGISCACISWHSGYRLIAYYADLTEIKAREAEIKAAEEHMKLMFEATPLCCHLINRNYKVIDCSREALRLFGEPDKQKYLDNFYSFAPERQPNGEVSSVLAKKIIREAFETDGRTIIEWMHCDKVGNLIPTEVTLTRVKYKDGYIMTSYMRDLREMKKMQKEADEANEHIRIMLDSMPMTSTIFDENLNLVECNKVALELFDVPDKQTFLDAFYDYSPEFQPDGSPSKTSAQKNIQDAFDKGDAVVRWIHQRRNGELIPTEVTLVRVKHKEGYIVIGYARDLREIVKMTEEADEANERIKLMLDCSPLICVLRDENLNVIDCNQEALKIFGVTHKNDFTKDINKFYPEYQPDGKRSTEKIPELYHNLLETNTLTFEWVFQSAEGEPIPAETKVVKLPWKNTFRCLSYSRDLRETKVNEKRIQESLEQNRTLEVLKEKAQAASEAKSQFLASMSHEIRTPMNTIIGLLDLMRTDNLDATQTQYIHDVTNMSRFLLEIINSILDFHKIEAGKFELLPVHFNLKTLCNNLVSQYRFLAESKELTFMSQIAPDLPHCLYGDEVRINQVVTNLISNAIKYTQQGFVNFTVDGVVENGKEYVAFTVEDSGIGIEEENFAVLFNQFEQFDRRKNRGIPGTGLGLPIAKYLAEKMEGVIRFRSEYCKGSVFTFLLPLVQGIPEQIDRIQNFDRVIAQSDTKVLVVDDNPGNITVAIGLLARHGIAPETADNGLQAIEMIQNKNYDLVFMDHMMPEMDGIQATKIIREWKGEYYETLPIIALSANAIAGAKEMFIACGMNDFISKPVIGNDLNRALLRWLPKNKIQSLKPAAETVEPIEEEGNLNEVLQELTKIDDLSIISGLSRVGGDKKLYRDVLRQFCQSTEEDIHALKKHIKDGLWKAYTVRVHAVKSVLATIGNKFLSEWAFRLEKAATDGDTDKCLKENRNFCTALSKFHAKLLQTNLMSDVAAIVKKQKITHRILRKKLERLRTACDDFNHETAEPITKELQCVTLDAPLPLSTAMDTSLSEINTMVHVYDYDKAVEAIEKLLRML